jgi:hypothetical protein
MQLKGRTIAVATPMYNNYCVGDYVESLLGLQNHLWGNGADMVYIRHSAISDIAMARNLAVGQFLQTGCTDLLFIDADMGFEPGDVIRMLALERDVVGAICPSKAFDWPRMIEIAGRRPEIAPEQLELSATRFGTFKTLYGTANIPLDEPFEVAGIGTGIMSIRRNVFERMEQAYPDRKISIARNPRLAPSFAPGTQSIGAPFATSFVDEEAIGEDMTFCANWRAIGGKVWACPWFTVRHVGNYAFKSNLRSIADAGASISWFSEARPAGERE